MAYIVLGLGALMTLIGACAVVFGYPVIELERGWASVIAGATLIAGGIMTAALGLVLRALIDLKSLLKAPAQGASDLREPTAVGAEPALELEPSIETAPPVGAPRDAVPGLEMPALDRETRADVANAHEPAAGVQHIEEPLAPIEPEPERFHSGLEPDPVPDPVDHNAEREPGHAGHGAHDHVSETASHDGYAIQAPSTPEHDLLPPSKPRLPVAPPIGDWLDRAFSDLDREHGHEARRDPAPAVVAQAEPSALEPETTPAIETAATMPASHPQAAPIEEHAAVAAESAVIGRYEADGTSYVMFADGSIEAQSDAGIYRFSSMAELKAFIEG